jgi:hypothetical protein
MLGLRVLTSVVIALIIIAEGAMVVYFFFSSYIWTKLLATITLLGSYACDSETNSVLGLLSLLDNLFIIHSVLVWSAVVFQPLISSSGAKLLALLIPVHLWGCVGLFVRYACWPWVQRGHRRRYNRRNV